jgi:hypothetical protein
VGLLKGVPKKIFHKRMKGKTVDAGQVINKTLKDKADYFTKKYGKVSFDKDGLLNLKDQAVARVKVPDNVLKGKNPFDSKQAMKILEDQADKGDELAAKYLDTIKNADPDSVTWHHGPDGEMQLVPKELHDAITHSGYAAVIRNAGSVVGAIIVPNISEKGFSAESALNDIASYVDGADIVQQYGSAATMMDESWTKHGKEASKNIYSRFGKKGAYSDAARNSVLDDYLKKSKKK